MRDEKKDLKEIVARRIEFFRKKPEAARDVRYTFTVETPDDEGRIRALAEKVIAHCPVVDSLIKPTVISGEITVVRGAKA